MDLRDWWRNAYGSKPDHRKPEPPDEPMVEPMRENPLRDVSISFVVRVYEDGTEVTDLLRSVAIVMQAGAVTRGTYVVEVGSGLRRTVEFGRELGT